MGNAAATRRRLIHGAALLGVMSCVAHGTAVSADTCHPSGMAISAQQSLGEPGARSAGSTTLWLGAHGSYAAFDRGAGAGTVAAMQLTASATLPWLRAAVVGTLATVDAADGGATGLADPIASAGVRVLHWGKARSYALWASAAVTVDAASSMYLGDGHSMAMPGLAVEVQDGAWYAQVDGMYHVKLNGAGADAHAHHHGHAGIANVINPMTGTGLGMGARLGKVLSPKLAVEGSLSGQFANDGIYQAKASVVTALGVSTVLEAGVRIMSVAGSFEPGLALGVRSAWRP